MSGRAALRAVLLLCSVLSHLCLLAAASPPQAKHGNEDHRLNHRRQLLELAESRCEGTLYPSLCVSSVVGITNLVCRPLTELVSILIRQIVGEVKRSSSVCFEIDPSLGFSERIAVGDCVELLDRSVAELNGAVADISDTVTVGGLLDIQTQLSAVITNQYTCLDGFNDVPKTNVRGSIKASIEHIAHQVSNALAMTKRIPPILLHRRDKPLGGPVRKAGGLLNKTARGLLDEGGFPSWLTSRNRRLLQEPVSRMKFDLVVAKDGSGNFTTISDAVGAAPNKSETTFVIYIKAGGYFENVEVISKKKNLMFVGDGMWKTVVKASRNVADGWTTFRSATVAVSGNGFLARDMTFENSAGPSKHQAVALRSSSDFSAFYRCSFAAYQDTLYVHSLRQFYRECDVYGTVDFIFGNAAVVLQKCNIYARKPNPNQKNVVTAQGRKDPNQNTGISIQNSKIAAASDLIPVQSSFKTYLGRPWKEFSRTVIINTYIGSLIEPAGWLEWDGDFALNTLYYGEYNNRGPGANTTRRVTWPGYRVITNATEAAEFTPGPFLQGDEWLPESTFPYAYGLF